MLKAAICDDEEYIVEKAVAYILQYGEERHIDFKIYKFNNGEALINSDVKFDIVFLDIQMQGLDGLQTGKIIKERDMAVQVVYITSFADESLRAHKIHAFDFIVKPFEYQDIEAVLNDFKRLDKKLCNDFIRVRLSSGDELIQNADEIIYLEYKGSRTIEMNTVNGVIEIKGNLFEIFEKLDVTQFAHTHKGFIVNLMWVKSIEKGYCNVNLKDGSSIPLSYKKRIEFKEKLHKFMRV